MLEKIPFLHRNTAYNILIEDDISFDALHFILDELLEKGSFDVDDGFADIYKISHEGTTYTVGVDGMDVMIVIK